MDYGGGGGDHKKADYGIRMALWLQDKVRVCALWIRRRLNAGAVCEAQRRLRGTAVLYKCGNIYLCLAVDQQYVWYSRLESCTVLAGRFGIDRNLI